MLKKTIQYVDYDGNDREETHYFNISKAELIALEASEKGGLGDYIQKIIDAGDNKVLMEAFVNIIKLSYGKKSEDGRRFTKSDDLWDEFSQTEAYSSLFVELTTNEKASAEFIRGIVPSPAEIDKMFTKPKSGVIDHTETEVPAWLLEDRNPTKAEINKMGKMELAEAMKRKSDEAASGADSETETLRKQLLGE